MKNFKKLISIVALIVLTIQFLAFTIPVKAQTTYSYSFAGPVDEQTAINLPNNVTVTANYASGAGASDTFQFNATSGYIFNTTNVVKNFFYDYNNTATLPAGELQHREYWLTSFETGDNLTLTIAFSTNELSQYTINFLDYVGTLKNYQYIEIRALVFSGYYIVERRPVDAQNSVIASLREGYIYQLIYTDGSTNNLFGDLTPSTSANIQLVLRGVSFSSSSLLTNKYVHAYAIRDFLNPIGAITTSYEDTTNVTTSVNITIIDQDTGLAVDTHVFASSNFSYTWNSAVNATDYEVSVIAVTTAYGTLTFKQFLLGEYSTASSPFSLDFLGTASVPTNWIIPALLIIFVAGCFSELNAEQAAIITVLIGIVLTAMGWISISAPALVVGLALSIISAISLARRRFT